MIVLITGGAGYIGSVLTELLLKQDLITSVIVYDNLYYRQTSLAQFCANDKLRFVFDDVRNLRTLRQYADVADVIIPLAALVGQPICDREEDLATQLNYEQVRLLCKWGFAHKIIYPNTNSGYGINTSGICTEDSFLAPISHYGITKVQAEKYLLDTKEGISLRLATVFGVSHRMRLDLLVNDFTFRAVRDGYLVLFEKDFKRNYIHVRDVAKTFLFMIVNQDKCRGQAYNVGLTEANLSKLELAELIKKYVPKLAIEINNFKEDPDKRNYIVSNAKLEALGWKPEITIEQGIAELVKAHTFYKHSSQQYGNQ